MEGIVNLHHDLMFVLTFILFFVTVIMVRTMYFFRYNEFKTDFSSQSVIHGTTIEII
jgi:heme/copper-type cytochrome/quinol oxidase subunit 2